MLGILTYAQYVPIPARRAPKSVPVVNGVFNVLIGPQNAAQFLLLAFDVPYWLGVKVGLDPEMTPRQPVAASACAIRAASAEALAPTATAAGTQITGALSNATLPATKLTGAVGLYAFSTGNAVLGAGTYFVGQGMETFAGSLWWFDFPVTSGTVLDEFDSASLIVPTSGNVVSFSACLKGAAPDGEYDVYLAAKDVAHTRVDLLNWFSRVTLTTTTPCGTVILNVPMNAFQTFAPWVQSVNPVSNNGIAITVTFAGN